MGMDGEKCVPQKWESWLSSTMSVPDIKLRSLSLVTSLPHPFYVFCISICAFSFPFTKLTSPHFLLNPPQLPLPAPTYSLKASSGRTVVLLLSELLSVDTTLHSG